MFELTFPQQQILSEIADKAFSQKDVALTYYFCMTNSRPVDWTVINAAILARWPKGLIRVKQMAHAHRPKEQEASE